MVFTRPRRPWVMASLDGGSPALSASKRINWALARPFSGAPVNQTRNSRLPSGLRSALNRTLDARGVTTTLMGVRRRSSSASSSSSAGCASKTAKPLHLKAAGTEFGSSNPVTQTGSGDCARKVRQPSPPEEASAAHALRAVTLTVLLSLSSLGKIAAAVSAVPMFARPMMAAHWRCSSSRSSASR